MPNLLAFALTIFTSAFLLFQVQPLIAKFILPWFGGGPAVWAISMLFFQASLVAGYAYAHCLVKYLSFRQQAIIHITALLLGLTQIPLSPSGSFDFDVAPDPTWQILILLARTIGIPFFILSATAPLIQAWVSHARVIDNPYRLYALSNAASLTALLSYPFIVEPYLSRGAQTSVWSALFIVFLALCIYCAFQTGFRPPAGNQDDGNAAGTEMTKEETAGVLSWMLWLAFPAAAVVMLLSVTNQLTRDLVSVPFLWVLPLSVYLLSFIISFDNDRWYLRKIFIPVMVLCIVATLYILSGGEIPVLWAVFIYTLSLFILCMVCHGELYRIRPASTQLTGFYLMIAVGGALGSALVALLMPKISNNYLELQIGIAVVASLTTFMLARDIKGLFSPGYTRAMQAGLCSALILTSALLVWSARDDEPDIVSKERNFFGVLTVGRDYAGSKQEVLWLRNGTSYHGAQFTDPQYRLIPTAYYSPISGVAFALNFMQAFKIAEGSPERRIGMVGLGVGTVASYAKTGDYMRIYEINPEVVQLAEERFTYLQQAQAEVDVVVGDARLSLEQEPAQDFDVFILDAFSSDSIPVHLLTREAFEIYLRHLDDDGIIAVLISSWHFDFEPMLHEMAKELELNSVLLKNESGNYEAWGSRWMILTRNERFMKQRNVRLASGNKTEMKKNIRVWTDDFSSPFQLLKE